MKWGWIRRVATHCTEADVSKHIEHAKNLGWIPLIFNDVTHEYTH